MTKKRVFLIDRHALAREGLRCLINAQPDLTVCGEIPSCQDSLPKVVAVRPDLVVIEPFCRSGFCCEFITDLRKLHPVPLILAVSMGEEATYAERILRAGANGFLTKDHSGPEILAGIRQVLRGEICVSHAMAATILQRLTGTTAKAAQSAGLVDQLGNRELEIFRLIGQGQSTRQIAKNLNLGVSTVETYRSRLRLKLGLKTGAEVTRRAICWVEGTGKQNYQI